MAFTEDQLYNMSDEELEQAYAEAQVDEDNTEVGEANVDEDYVEPAEVDNEADDLEQPEDQDSDDNADVDNEVEEETEEDPETEASEPDGDTTEEEGQPEAEEDKAEEETQPVQTYKFKANGMEYEFTEDEMKQQFPRVFGQAMDYTKKMQQIKPWRQTIDAIEQAGIDKNDLNLAIDVLKGDKDAIGALLKRTGVDALDLDTEESNYVPKDYGRDETAIAIQDVVDEISRDPEFVRTEAVLTKDWDEGSLNEITKDPQLIKALHIDVRDGTFDRVQPIAAKMKVYDGGRMSDLDYYKEAAKVYFAEQEQSQQAMQAQEQMRMQAKQAKQAELERVQKETAQREATEQKAEQRKRAVPSKKSAGTKTTVTDYLDDSDEEFEKWYKDKVENFY